jgi:hypothetical protein
LTGFETGDTTAASDTAKRPILSSQKRKRRKKAQHCSDISTETLTCNPNAFIFTRFKDCEPTSDGQYTEISAKYPQNYKRTERDRHLLLLALLVSIKELLALALVIIGFIQTCHM